MNTFAKLVTKFAKPIAAIWLLFFFVMAYFAVQLPSKLQGDGFSVEDDHVRVIEELSDTFGLPANSILVLFENKTEEEINSLLKDFQQVEEIDSITSPIGVEALNKNGIAYVTLNFDNTIDDFFPIIDELREIIGKENGIDLTGEPVISKDINEASQRDLMKAEAIGIPIAIIVLLLAFGTILSALLPVLIGGITVVAAFGFLTLLSDSFNLSIFVLNIVPMLGLALSIDFALLFINRYREERERATIEESVQIAIRTAGRSIIFSALCVMIGLGAMVVINVDIFQNIALGGAIVVFLAIVSGLTLLPASILLLGDRLNKWRILRVKPTAGSWQKFAAFVMRRPILIILTACILLGIAMIPVKDIKLTIPTVDSLPTSYEARQAYDTLSDEFHLGKEATVFLLAERDGGWNNEDGFNKMLSIQEKLLKDERVTDVLSMFSVAGINSVEAWKATQANPQRAGMLDEVMNTFIQDEKMYMTISIDANGASTKAQDFVREWKDKNLGVSFALAGQPKFNQEIFDEISDKIVLALIIIVSTTFIILMLAFRSILIPIKAIMMNIIGLCSTFGILVYIFQYGHFGIESGTIALIIPVIVFCLVFGLSMDYEVFLISRIQEEYDKGSSNTKATIDGLVSTSKIITSAALIMIVITGAFAFTDVMPVKQIGVGIAIAVAIDATIIRLMLVPSLMKLFGDWNWWLPFSKRKS